jgi:hypothetical protein
MQKKRKIILVISMFLLIAAMAAGVILASGMALPGSGSMAKLYVSPKGKGNLCFLLRPCSLKYAQMKARSLNRNMTGDITIYLHGGMYPLDQTLTFTQADSGTNGFNVTYTSYREEIPQISGGRNISGWVKDANGIYKASVPVDLAPFCQLFVNGARAIRARTPNRTDSTTFGPYFQIIDWQSLATDGIKIRAEDISNWHSLDDVEMVIEKYWNQSRLRIASSRIQGNDAFVLPREPELDIEKENQYPMKAPGQAYYLENSFEFLDAEGEWFLDNAAHTLYYMPRAGEDMAKAEVIAPDLEQLVILDGAQHIRFKHVSFEYSTWRMPNDSRIGLQAGTRYDSSEIFVPSGITLKNTHHIRFEQCTFQHMGGAGIELAYATHDDVIDNSTFTDISGNGITIYTDLGHPNAAEEQQCHDEVISNNKIYHVAQEYSGDVGINVTYASKITIDHNQIWDLPYTGISLGWGWTSETTALRDNLVEFNDIQHVMQLHDDGAGIYTLSKQPGTRLLKNYIHDIQRSKWAAASPITGIYLDEQTSGTTVELNTIENVPELYNFHKVGLNTIILVNEDGNEVTFTVGQ